MKLVHKSFLPLQLRLSFGAQTSLKLLNKRTQRKFVICRKNVPKENEFCLKNTTLNLSKRILTEEEMKVLSYGMNMSWPRNPNVLKCKIDTEAFYQKLCHTTKTHDEIERRKKTTVDGN